MNNQNRVFLLVVILCVMSIFGICIYTTSEKPAVSIKFQNKIQEVLPSIVMIKCKQWQGSGVSLTEDIVATARHVVEGKKYIITLSNGCVVEGTQAVSHKDYDIGFIRINPECVAKDCEKHKHNEDWNVETKHKIELLPAKFGSIKDCVLGQPIFIVGTPYGKINFNNVTLGIISGIGRDWDFIDPWTGEKYGWKIAFTSDSAAHPGNSGGPVFSMDGKVRGLLVGGFSPVLNCSMPSDLFMDDIELIKMMFGFDKYKIEEEEKPKSYMYPVESREDYYLDD